MSLYTIANNLVLHYKLDDVTNGIIDSSGNHHHGSITGTISTNSDSGRYSNSIYFRNYNTPSISVLNIASLTPSLNNCTIAWWAKYDTNKTLLLTGQSTNYYIGASNNNTFYNGGAGSPVLYKDGVAGSYVCAADGWHHFVLVGANLSSWSAIKINGYSSEWPLKGYISDLRIYNTSLSNDDIFQLYRVSAKVLNNQDLHTFELVENQSKISINRRGQLLCNELEEDNATKFYKTNQIIETNNIIEL